MRLSINLWFVFLEEGLDYSAVEGLSTVGIVSEEEQEEGKLEQVPVRNHPQDAAEVIFDKEEKAEDDPVGKPLLIAIR